MRIKNSKLATILNLSAFMLVFGVVDNGLMILFGDIIDKTLSDTFNLSVMASAGWGNAISDAVSVLVASLIPEYIPEQPLTRVVDTGVKAFSVFAGCVLALSMIPFLSLF